MSDESPEIEKSPEEAIALLFESLSFMAKDPQVEIQIKALLENAINKRKLGDEASQNEARAAYSELDNLRFKDIESRGDQDDMTIAEIRATVLDARYYFYTDRVEDAREELRNAADGISARITESSPAIKMLYDNIKILQQLIREHFAEE